MTARQRFLAGGAAVVLALAGNCACAASAPAALAARGPEALVVNFGSATVTPIDLATGAAGAAVRVGRHPDAIVATHDGRTVYVANGGSGTVTPISVAAGPGIRVARNPVALAMALDGRTVYVACETRGRGTVVPISTSTNRAGRLVRVGWDPVAIAVTPDGRTVLVADAGNPAPNLLTPISARTGVEGKAIRLPGFLAGGCAPDPASGTARGQAGSCRA